MRMLLIGAFLLAILAGCDQHAHDNGGDHGHAHGADNHTSHDDLANGEMNTGTAAAHHDDLGGIDPHSHGGEDTGEAHHDDLGGQDDHGHGHGGDTTIAITHFTDATELFVEFPAFVIGRQSPFAAHLTRLDSYAPVAEGTVTVTLRGGGVADEVFSVSQPSTPGIFRPVAIPKNAVKRRVTLTLKGEGLHVVHDLGEYTVHPSQALARTSLPHEDEPDDAIAFLKEQQWLVDFAVAQAIQGKVRASVAATGVLRPRADGEVYINASSTGHLQRQNTFPYVGMQVERGQQLAIITPHLGTGGDIATLKAALDKARSEYHLARHERRRLEKLWREKAIAKHRLEEAKSAEAVARSQLNATERRYKQSTGEHRSDDAGISVLAPIDGVLAQVNAASGQYVNEGDMLFHIVNLDRLWLEARITEADLGKLKQPDAAWFNVEGFDKSFDTRTLDGRMIAMGGIVDPVSRTAPQIIEIDNPGRRFRAGMFANIRVFTGEVDQGVVVPQSALFDDGGQDVVYVMLGGESFQRRVVQPGIREGDKVVIHSGINAGEYVVSRGAYQLRLASASPAEAGHGHAH